jgi:ribosomal protein S18 acetylase RimI-like enzyme
MKPYMTSVISVISVVGVISGKFPPLAICVRQNIHCSRHMHPLDNPAWSALTTHQSSLALVEGMARRFPPEMAVHGALALPIPQAWESLARLARAPVGLFTHEPLHTPPGWTVTRHVELLEMVHAGGEDTPFSGARADVIELGEIDLPQMSALYEATRPGRKICPRIQKLGTFLGIRQDGRLVAMAGLRMHLPGYREITTVATMPGFEGRGYAMALVGSLVERIRERGESPFLTVRTDNERAINIYKRLGFRERIHLHSTSVVAGTS